MAEKWDGITRAADIARVLIKFIISEDRNAARTLDMARTMAYGDFGRYLEKRYEERFHGGCVSVAIGDDFVQTDSKGVTVTFDFRDGDDEAYKLTWNKAAKLICEHIDEYDGDEDDDEDEVTDIAPIEKKEYMSENAKYAFTVHAQIVTGAQMVEDGLYLMAVGYKKMRDEKLYKELGYKSFEEYCETGTGMSRMQVYNYIRVAEKIPQQEFVNSGLQTVGIKKLTLLTALDDEQRAEIAESTDLESTTVKELKAKIEELKCENDILTEQNGTLESDNNALTAQVDDLMENGRVKWDTHEIDRQKIYRAKSLYDVAKNAFLDLSRLAKNEPVTQKIFNDLLNFIDDERNGV